MNAVMPVKYLQIRCPGVLLEEFEVDDANAEVKGLKKRLGSGECMMKVERVHASLLADCTNFDCTGLRIAFEEVKEAAEYTSIPQPWLRDGEHLLLLLLSIHVCLVPSTPLQGTLTLCDSCHVRRC